MLFRSVLSHNDLATLQGGTANQYYHLTNSEYTGTGSGTFVRTNSPNITTPNILNTSDSTKQIKFDVSGTTGTSTTIKSSQTSDVILTLPDETGTLITVEAATNYYADKNLANLSNPTSINQHLLPAYGSSNLTLGDETHVWSKVHAQYIKGH